MDEFANWVHLMFTSSIQVIAASDLKKYTLKQFVHNDSGQYMVGELDGDLYLLVPGTPYSFINTSVAISFDANHPQAGT